MENKSAQKNPWKIISIVLILVLLLIIGLGGGYYWGRIKNKAKDPQSSPSSSISPTKTVAVSAFPTCSTLTSEEKSTIENWETYTNNKYHFTFKYPKEWGRTLPGDTPDEMASFVEVVNEESLAAVNLIFFGPEQVGRNPVPEEDLEDTKLVQVGCQSAKYRTYLPSLNDRTEMNQFLILTTFSKDSNDFQLRLVYPQQGASVDADNVEAYNLVLKSFKFN